MPRRRSSRATAREVQEVQQPGEHPATQLRGHGEGGSVRPADNRFLDADEIALRDEYVEQVTGETAQQLVVKEEAPEHVEELSSRDAGAAPVDDSEPDRR